MASTANEVTRWSLESGDYRQLAWLEELVEHAAHLLPAQGPITAFVHHNTLHAFEDLPFDDAVVQGARTFGCHPYLPEAEYRKKLAEGQMSRDDLEWALLDDLGDRADDLLGFLGTRYHLRLAMLAHPLYTGPTAELRWVIAETDALRRFRPESPPETKGRLIQQTRHWIMRDLRGAAPEVVEGHAAGAMIRLALQPFDTSGIERWDEDQWESLTLHLLWLLSRDGIEYAAPPQTTHPPAVRPRDHLLRATGADADVLVHDLLIRFCSVFLDQGFAGWRLPLRNAGFFKSFCELYGRPGGPPDRWMRGLAAELRRISAESMSPVESIAASLEDLGVQPDETGEFVTQTLLALRGFAGMIWQTESRGDRVAEPSPPGTLLEFLAVRLILDRVALRFLARETLGYRGPLRELSSRCDGKRAHSHPTPDQRAFTVFQLAQLLGWEPPALARLTSREWAMLVEETEAFSGLDRRRVFHHALERRYRLQTLDAVALHSRRVDAGEPRLAPATRPSFQIVCCIDDREESFRRHLEEVEPNCETFGAAGFFGVAMYYKGAADAHFTPLCPVSIQPRHYVVERVAYSMKHRERRRRKQRRTIGTVTHRVHVGSRTFAGGWLAAVLGSIASIPLVMRILFPRTAAQLRRLMGGFVRPPEVTMLQLERTADEPGPEGEAIGYRVDEMADIVEGLLRAMGLTRQFARLVIMVGHGSSCLNNPQEAAYDCGACSGGRGGPNARAFAQMANDPRVRAILRERGLQIPDDTVFVGSYHNTCDDSMAYYDLDRLPPTHHDDFAHASTALDVAREWNAHERCRRFQSADLDWTPEEALRHVEGRAEDLSQVRPECGHATNALCFVGRRDWSRGLFLDRRCFLQSYDYAQDDADRSLLAGILGAVIPVCAGINLEYYFSFVDPTGYGCGTKLPHNITSLLGVMNGAASDLRPGLPWQMVEIHEPLRLLCVIEAPPEAVQAVLDGNPTIAVLVKNGWVQVATLDPQSREIHWYHRGRFRPYRITTPELPTVKRSVQWYRGWRDHLGFAHVEPSGR